MYVGSRPSGLLTSIVPASRPRCVNKKFKMIRTVTIGRGRSYALRFYIYVVLGSLGSIGRDACWPLALVPIIHGALIVFGRCQMCANGDY
jgi:hypothetical protein